LLKRWYAERKILQRNKDTWERLESGISLPDELVDLKVDF